jgi:peptidyl-prolyl cis-trans isomerase D
MLRFLRKYSNSTGIKILYGVLAGLFILWGVGAVGGQRMDVVARVGGQPISRRDVERATAALQHRFESMPPEVVRSLNLRERALDQLIEDVLVRQEAERLGIRVTEAELIEAITRMPEFQEDGRFSRERVEAVLRYQRDRGEFEDELRRSILFQRLQSLVTDGVHVSDGEVEERYRLDHAQVNLAFVRIPAAGEEKGISLTDQDLTKYLQDHSDRYRIPAKVRARYVAYRRTDFLAQADVPESAIADYYELHQNDRFTEPEQVHAEHILVKVASDAGEQAKAAARKKAEDLLAKIRAGGDFAALARKNSDDPGSAAKGGDLGFFGRGTMTPAFESAAFELEPGKVSAVVETPFGFHIIRVEEHKPGSVKPLDAVRDEIVQALRGEQALELARQQAEGDRRAVVRGKSLAEAAAGRAVEETPPFAATDEIAGVGRVKAFADAAFALREGEVSDLVETDDAVYLLTPFERTEAHLPPLVGVRDRVTADARRERAEAAARTRAEALLARAKETGFDKAAEEAGLKVEETGYFERQTATLPGLPPMPELRTDALALTADAPLAPKVYAAGGDAVVAALWDRKPADMSGLAAAKDGLHDSLLQQKRQAVVRGYVDFLKESALRAGRLDVRADSKG